MHLHPDVVVGKTAADTNPNVVIGSTSAGMPPPPRFETENPFVEAQQDPDPDQALAKRDLLDGAAALNQPRVRELIALTKRAQGELEQGELACAMHSLQALEFGLGALLPRVNVKVSARLAELLSQSGRRKAA